MNDFYRISVLDIILFCLEKKQIEIVQRKYIQAQFESWDNGINWYITRFARICDQVILTQENKEIKAKFLRDWES